MYFFHRQRQPPGERARPNSPARPIRAATGMAPAQRCRIYWRRSTDWRARKRKTKEQKPPRPNAAAGPASICRCCGSPLAGPACYFRPALALPRRRTTQAGRSLRTTPTPRQALKNTLFPFGQAQAEKARREGWSVVPSRTATPRRRRSVDWGSTAAPRAQVLPLPLPQKIL